MIQCSGWWQQHGYGRQPMHELQLDFRGPSIIGQGRDLIAAFTLAGKLRPDGGVELIKQYQHRHSVLYVGTYDGEGTLSGRWDISGHQGQWTIRLLKSTTRPSDSDDDIHELS
ncbi:MAG: hypothetical protein KF752_17080 [Pirellulaceae bacterium]|nr:hypothetical protein [Pirellulaceae bacterium]